MVFKVFEFELGLGIEMVGSEASRILLQQKTPEGPPKQYGIRKPLSQAGPTEADVQRTKELEKFLLDVELYKSTKKAVKKEELLCQLNQIYLGSWDCKINLWQTNDLEIGGELVSIKKRKKGNEIDEPQVEGKATSTLVRHAQCVSFVVRLERGTIFSTSCDHSVRKWDVETGQETSNMIDRGVHRGIHNKGTREVPGTLDLWAVCRDNER